MSDVAAHPAAAAFEALLDAEEQAARRADVDTLLSLQQDKKHKLAALRASAPGEEVVDALTRRAQHNIALMKHLMTCLRGLVEAGVQAPAGTTYGKSGERQVAGGGALRVSL